MPTMMLDEPTSNKLRSLVKPTNLYDSAGKLIGMMVPADAINMQPELSEEEIERRCKSEKVYTTAQVIKHLESLT